jgi:hypothetical protein
MEVTAELGVTQLSNAIEQLKHVFSLSTSFSSASYSASAQVEQMLKKSAAWHSSCT